MEETIIKAAILVSFIFCGYTLKQLRLFGRSTFNTISTIVFNITLPSVILVNLNGIHFDTRYLLISLLAIIFNLIMVGMGYAAGRTKDEKAFYMLNMNGYNIGNFALPFVSYFFDSAAVSSSASSMPAIPSCASAGPMAWPAASAARKGKASP